MVRADQNPITPDVMNSSDVPDSTLVGSSFKLARIVGPAQDFANNCQGCHGAGGFSVDEVPALRDRIGYFTRTKEARAYLIEVPNVSQSQLGDERLAALMNWLVRTYGSNTLAPDFVDYTPKEIAAARLKHIEPAAVRAAIIEHLIAERQVPTTVDMGLKPFRNY